MLFAAILTATIWVAIVSTCGGWFLGAEIGDERGVIGWTLGGLALTAGILFGLSA